MRTCWLESTRTFFLLAVLLLLAACGGGGGGGSSNAVVYAGNVSPAIVTSANASQLTANVVGGNDIASAILGLSIDEGDPLGDLGGGVMDVGLRLNRTFRDILVQAQRSGSSQKVARGVVPIDETEPCEGNLGTVRTSGTLSDVGTGTLSVNFNNCSIAGVILNGPAALLVQVFDLVNFIPTDFTISFSRLTLRGVGISIDTSGSLRTQIDIGTNTETITQNFVTLNNNTNLMTKIENLTVVSVYNNILSPTSFTSTLNGRVFDQANGYVDITTTVSLVFNTLSQLFPNSGQIMLTGADNRRVRVTALSATLVMLELDVDGNGSVDHTATLKWTELDGPVGSDLADADGDGMHNSWETANGLNPGLDDAAGDPDSDNATNLSEYQAGTDPNDINSHP